MSTDKGLWHVTGHDHAVELLARSLEAPAHAYLLVGPRGIGKRTLGIELAKALNCEVERERRPCQTCRSCRLIGRLSHPDVSLIIPEKESVSIDQIRELRQQLALVPAESPWRIVVARADALTEMAADALLKTLEEPHPQIVLVLTARNIHVLPETIVSRCRVIVLGLIATDVIGQELQGDGVEHVEAARLAALSYGSLGWAKNAAADSELADRREQIREDLARWGGGSILARLQAAESLSRAASRPDKTRALVMEELEIMMTWWRDVLLATSGQPELVVNQAARAAIERTASSETVKHAHCVMRSIAVAAARISGNVDPRLTLEALAVGL